MGSRLLLYSVPQHLCRQGFWARNYGHGLRVTAFVNLRPLSKQRSDHRASLVQDAAELQFGTIVADDWRSCSRNIIRGYLILRAEGAEMRQHQVLETFIGVTEYDGRRAESTDRPFEDGNILVDGLIKMVKDVDGW